MAWKSVFFLFCFGCLALGKVVSYRGQQVISLQVQNKAELDLLENLQKTSASGWDVWSYEGNLVIGENHIMMKNTTASELQGLFTFKVMIPDVGNLIHQVDEDHKNQMEGKVEGFFDNYRRYQDIVTEIKTLASRFPNLSKFVPSIGKSVEGRDIPAIHLCSAGFENQTAQRIFFMGGQHAREWIGPATVMYLISQFLELYGSDPVVTHLLDNVEFVIIPLSNPDGYEYAHTNERLWRKNRRKNTGGSFGVDLNRNWNEHWGGSGSSGVPTSDTYRGTAPFSEPESLAISNYITKNNANLNIMAAIDFHSYSQLVMRPYGWTTAKCPDEVALKIIGDGVAYEIEDQSGYMYSSIRSIDLYITTGTASDWYYQEEIWGAYTIELRDTGKYGFVLPPAQIIPTGEEILASMRYFCMTVLDTHPTK